MKYLLLSTFICLSYTAFSQSEAAHLQELQKKWANAKAYTMALAESMPAAQYGFRPVEGEMNFAEQMTHLSSNMVWLSSDYLTTAQPPRSRKEIESFSKKSKAEVLEVLEESLNHAAETLKNLDPSQLNETVKFFSGPMTKRQILNLMNDHLTHHRAQAIVYLRLNGVLPPKYVGW